MAENGPGRERNEDRARTLERYIEEEMVLKDDAIHRRIAWEDKTKQSAEDELKTQIHSLESQLEDERKKTAETDTAAVEVQQASKTTDDEMEVLQRTTEGFGRGSGLSKKNTSPALCNRLLATASQSWHPNHPRRNAPYPRRCPSSNSLTHERTARRDGTSSLQISLDDTSRHILKLNVRANELQVENDDLPNELRKSSSERQPMEVEMRVVNTSIV